jgi:hypothetical protein
MKNIVLGTVICFGASVVNPAFADTPSPSAQDVAVLTVVLAHFSKSKHSAQYNSQGYVGVAPTTNTLVATLTDNDYLKSQPTLSPAPPQSAVANYVRRNRQSYRLGEFPLLGGAVRLDRTEPDLGMLPLDPKGALRTYVHLRVPGYSPDAQWAYVSFTYLWSIHGAFATYLLRREDGGWVVVATDFAYAV